MAAPASSSAKVGIALTAVAGGLAIAGSFMPWARFSIGLIDSTETPTGMDEGAEGEWSLALGALLLLVAAGAWAWGHRRAALASVALIASVVLGVLMIADLQQTNEALDSYESTFDKAVREAGLTEGVEGAGVTGGAESGFWTVSAAAVFGLIGSSLLLAAGREEAQPPPVADPGPSPLQSYLNPTAPTVSETKVCPRCAEEVKAAAQVCRFCGHEFERPDL